LQECIAKYLQNFALNLIFIILLKVYFWSVCQNIREKLKKTKTAALSDKIIKTRPLVGKPNSYLYVLFSVLVRVIKQKDLTCKKFNLVWFKFLVLRLLQKKAKDLIDIEERPELIRKHGIFWIKKKKKRHLQKLATLNKIWDFVGQIQNKIFLKTIGMFGFKVLGKYAYFWVNCQEGFNFF
jgi:hypothetical protein